MTTDKLALFFFLLYRFPRPSYIKHNVQLLMYNKQKSELFMKIIGNILHASVLCSNYVYRYLVLTVFSSLSINV